MNNNKLLIIGNKDLLIFLNKYLIWNQIMKNNHKKLFKKINLFNNKKHLSSLLNQKINHNTQLVVILINLILYPLHHQLIHHKLKRNLLLYNKKIEIVQDLLIYHILNKDYHLEKDHQLVVYFVHHLLDHH